jgi:hypothetical protein
MGGGIHRAQPGLDRTDQGDPFGAHLAQNRVEVVHLLVERGRSVERIGEAGATAIEHDQARERRHPLLVPDRFGVFPLDVQV